MLSKADHAWSSCNSPAAIHVTGILHIGTEKQDKRKKERKGGISYMLSRDETRCNVTTCRAIRVLLNILNHFFLLYQNRFTTSALIQFPSYVKFYIGLLLIHTHPKIHIFSSKPCRYICRTITESSRRILTGG